MKPEFSAAQTPLEEGFTIIEASAGTGKTTTISAIVLRLLVETELVTDQSRFVHEVVDDFWRAHFYSDDSIMAGVVRERLTPARLVELLVQLTNNPTLRVSPPSENRAALEAKITELCRAGDSPDGIAQLAERFDVSLQ